MDPSNLPNHQPAEKSSSSPSNCHMICLSPCAPRPSTAETGVLPVKHPQMMGKSRAFIGISLLIILHNNTARRCVLPGDLQGRSRQFYEDILHVISHFNIEFKGVADFYPSWWYEHIWHVISHYNIEFKGVADFNSSWWYEDIWHVISHFNIEFKGVADFNPSWRHEDQVSCYS